MHTGVLIVGASVAGIGAANELRRLGYTGTVTLADTQPHLPYDRPPLSKAVLSGDADLAAIAFHERRHYDESGLDVRLGLRAVDLVADDRRVLFDDGTAISADAIVITTGARARKFPVGGDGATVWTIREIEDGRRLAPLLSPGVRVAVIGGGFIGAEVASSARHVGCDVTVVEVAALPFAALVGTEVATMLAELHRRGGTDLHTGTSVRRITTHGGAQRLHLADGTVLDADVVVAGLGATPNVEWLADSKLAVDDAIPCDQFGRTAAAGVWAAGDVATWFNPVLGTSHRHEHWTSAREQARIVAHDIVGAAGPEWAHYVPYVWSDQYGARIQILGLPGRADAVRVVVRDETKPSFLALYGRAGRLVAVAGCNMAGRLMRYRPALADGGVPFDDA